MKVLLLYTYNQGFLSEFFSEVASYLADKGHEVNVFTLKNSEKEFKIGKAFVSIKKRKGYLDTYMQIFLQLKKLRPDVVISNFSYVNPAMLLGAILGVKKNIAWFHSLNEQTNATRSKILIKRQFLRLADRVVANSQQTKEQLINEFHVPPSKISAIPFFTNITERTSESIDPFFENASNTFVIGCPGRLAESKNQLLLVNALNRLNTNSDSSIKVLFAGKGNLEAILKERLNELPASINYEFVGHLSPNQMLTFYQNVDLIVLPSLHEAFGLVAIEALALGTPTLISKTFGALSFVDASKFNLDAITFNPSDPHELATKIEIFMSGKGPKKEYFQSIYRETFNKDLIFEDILKLLN